jgi:threonyl-tRNA synthetase
MESKSSQEYLDQLRHSASHLLAAAVLDIWPQAKPTLGPPIADGFYYDFDFGSAKVSEGDLVKIGKKMSSLIKSWPSFERIEVDSKAAKKQFPKNQYKHELIDEFSGEGQQLSLYKSGDFIDLCRGGHVDNPSKELIHFKLMSVAGAYWRGDEKNKMLTRIYGTAFPTKHELEDYLLRLAEAKDRDHRKLGKELDLFSFSELVGSGLPLWSPKGTQLRQELHNRLLEISRKYDMLPVTIPHIGKKRLYEISGHAEKFGNELLKVESHFDKFVMKPVNCPHHTQIYASQPRSYRDLPLRYMESTMQYRDEKPGEIGGLTRVRSITVDDGHIFCRVDQIKEEAKKIANIIEEFYTSLGLFGQHWVSLSVRDSKNYGAYIGETKDWDKAEAMLQELSDELRLNAKRVEGEAAIYGPKLDYVFKDSLLREWQLATIQIDFAMPKRFRLEYTDAQGQKATPVIIHRAILGSYERFLAILIEHFAGAFPLWLAPVQVKIVTVGEECNDYAFKLASNLKSNNIRVEVDEANETVGNKIRKAEKEKIPYMLVIGERETSGKTLTIRKRGLKEQANMDPNKFSKSVAKLIRDKSLKL